MYSNFSEFNLPLQLRSSLEKMGYKTPTPIQSKAIPVALEGSDVIGSAQTGTGKTAAFAVPLISKLIHEPNSLGLVLTPTRELAMQVIQLIHELLGKKSELSSVLLIGGESIVNQLNRLKKKPRIIVGTPGRVNDHIKRGSLKLNNLSMLVLDETDRMLDMGFGIQIDDIVQHIPKKRQTLMFSATMPTEIVRLSNKYLVDPVRISMDVQNTLPTNLEHQILPVKQDEKYEILLRELDKRKGSVIVFVKTKRDVDKLSQELKLLTYSVDKIHGDLKQSHRDRVIKSFRSQKCNILIATDVAARGLDIPHIEHVINYDLPQCPEDYIHRIGRTARAGAKGNALCLVSSEDYRKWKDISKLMDYKESDEMRNFFVKKSRNASKPSAKRFPGSKPANKPFSSMPKEKKFFDKKTSGKKFSTESRGPKKTRAAISNKFTKRAAS